MQLKDCLSHTEGFLVEEGKKGENVTSTQRRNSYVAAEHTDIISDVSSRGAAPTLSQFRREADFNFQ